MSATPPSGLRAANAAVADPLSIVLPVQLVGPDGLYSGGATGGTGGGDASQALQTTGNNTLAWILAKLVTNPATDALQTAGNSTLTTIAGKDFATQTTLSALLAKITADPSTATLQNSILSKLTADPATQTTLAAVVAKLSADPSTATLQAAANTALNNRYGGGQLSKTAQVTSSGTTTVLTPTSGKRAVIYWIGAINDPDAALSPRIRVGFNGAADYLYSAYAVAHWEIFTGNTDQALVVNLDEAGSVAVTVHYKEIT